MTSFLERLRGKSEATRTRYLFISVGASFLFVIAIWVSSLTVSLGTLLKEDAVGTVREEFRGMTGNAPDSLEALLKSGSVLSEEGKALGEMMKNPPKDEGLKPSEGVIETKPEPEPSVDETETTPVDETDATPERHPREKPLREPAVESDKKPDTSPEETLNP